MKREKINNSNREEMKGEREPLKESRKKRKTQARTKEVGRFDDIKTNTINKRTLFSLN